MICKLTSSSTKLHSRLNILPKAYNISSSVQAVVNTDKLIVCISMAIKESISFRSTTSWLNGKLNLTSWKIERPSNHDISQTLTWPPPEIAQLSDTLLEKNRLRGIRCSLLKLGGCMMSKYVKGNPILVWKHMLFLRSQTLHPWVETCR